MNSSSTSPLQKTRRFAFKLWHFIDGQPLGMWLGSAAVEQLRAHVSELCSNLSLLHHPNVSQATQRFLKQRNSSDQRSVRVHIAQSVYWPIYHHQNIIHLNYCSLSLMGLFQAIYTYLSAMREELRQLHRQAGPSNRCALLLREERQLQQDMRIYDQIQHTLLTHTPDFFKPQPLQVQVDSLYNPIIFTPESLNRPLSVHFPRELRWLILTYLVGNRADFILPEPAYAI